MTPQTPSNPSDPFLSVRPIREAGALALLLLLSAFLMGVRVASAPLPSGDEGSWLAVAAELAHGEGFTTRWLEYHWMAPYQVPRPDDMRYPALTACLALGMKAFGPSLLVLRGLVAALYLGFLAAAWYAVRLRFGPLVALLAAFAMALSPMQLEWSALVYCEGLFGLVLSLWLIWIQKVPAASRAHWIGSGILIALLCMVRPNAVLLVPGALAAALHAFRPVRRARGPMLLVLGAFLLALSPWLIRNAVHFGEPFHIGGSAGLLRENHLESATQGLGEFLSRYGVLFPLKRILAGIPTFLSSLHGFEKGMEVLPMILALAALLRRRPFLHPAAAWGFSLSFVACLYASYNSWAGLRYFSPFLPFVYAYGLHLALELAGRLGPSPAVRARMRPAAAALLAAAMGLAVLNPHRFWLRHFPAQETAYQAGLDDYARALESRLPGNRTYLANSLCQVNYMGTGLCVGLQGPGREEWLPRALAAFHPGLLALTPAELAEPDGPRLLEELSTAGYQADTLYRNRTGVLLRLSATPVAGPVIPAPEPKRVSRSLPGFPTAGNPSDSS